jgi:ribose transport system permease protein
LGQFLVIVTRGIDLSMGSTLALSSVAGALVANTAVGNGGTAIAAMALTGAAVGFVNGAVFVWGRIPHPFIITLATLTIARGLALTISGGDSVTPVPPVVVDAGGGTVGGFPIPVLLVLGFAVFVGVFSQGTRLGRWTFAVGGNPEGATRAGIPVNRVLIFVYMLSGLAAGIAGLITTGRTGAGTPTAGNLAELDAITAVIIGGVSFFGGRGRMHNVLVGALIFGVIRNGLNLLDVDPFWQLIATGLIIVVAVELDVLRQHLEARVRVLSADQA